MHLKVIWIALYPLEGSAIGCLYSRALWCYPALPYYPWFWNPGDKVHKVYLHLRDALLFNAWGYSVFGFLIMEGRKVV